MKYLDLLFNLRSSTVFSPLPAYDVLMPLNNSGTTSNSSGPVYHGLVPIWRDLDTYTTRDTPQHCIGDWNRLVALLVALCTRPAHNNRPGLWPGHNHDSTTSVNRWCTSTAWHSTSHLKRRSVPNPRGMYTDQVQAHLLKCAYSNPNLWHGRMYKCVAWSDDHTLEY